MPLIIESDHDILDPGGLPFIIPRDGNHSPVALLAGVDPSDVIRFGAMTPDGKLKVDASVSIDNVDIGDVNILLKVGGINHQWNGALNPDTITYSALVQDPRMSFTTGALNVTFAGGVSGLATEITLLNVFDGVRGLSPIQTTITRDVDGLVSSIEETDGILTKTSTLTRDVDDNVVSIAEVVA